MLARVSEHSGGPARLTQEYSLPSQPLENAKLEQLYAENVLLNIPNLNTMKYELVVDRHYYSHI